MHPEICLMQAGAGMEMTGRGYADFTEQEREAVIDTFYQGLKQRPTSKFGTFNDDFLAFKDPDFQRADLCSIILASPWR